LIIPNRFVVFICLRLIYFSIIVLSLYICDSFFIVYRINSFNALSIKFIGNRKKISFIFVFLSTFICIYNKKSSYLQNFPITWIISQFLHTCYFLCILSLKTWLPENFVCRMNRFATLSDQLFNTIYHINGSRMSHKSVRYHRTYPVKLSLRLTIS